MQGAYYTNIDRDFKAYQQEVSVKGQVLRLTLLFTIDKLEIGT